VLGRRRCLGLVRLVVLLVGVSLAEAPAQMQVSAVASAQPTKLPSAPVFIPNTHAFVQVVLHAWLAAFTADQPKSAVLVERIVPTVLTAPKLVTEKTGLLEVSLTKKEALAFPMSNKKFELTVFPEEKRKRPCPVASFPLIDIEAPLARLAVPPPAIIKSKLSAPSDVPALMDVSSLSP
jgi:hypothetical protein